MKILWISDFDPRGSGYSNISRMFCQKLAELGHDVKALGFEYKGQEHDFDFAIIPISKFDDLAINYLTIKNSWNPDAVIIALDIPWQENVHKFINEMANQVGYFSPFDGIVHMAILPLEAPPLTMSWAVFLMTLDKVFVMNKFGVEEFHKKFVKSAEYLPIPFDLEKWNPPTEEERKELRESWGFEDKFVILSVADNQERKNISKSIRIFAEHIKTYPESVFILVTRENLSVGWRLRDLVNDYEIPGDKFMILERGMPFEELRDLFCVADMYLSTSKAEGLGMPILEAMAMKLPVAGTNCTAIEEHLADSRGFPIFYDYKYIDPFGNGWRYLVSIEDGVDWLADIKNYPKEKLSEITEKARKYVEERDLETSVELILTRINEIKESKISVPEIAEDTTNIMYDGETL